MRLREAAVARQQWLTAQPFPHVVQTRVISADHAAAIGEEFPPPGDSRWHVFGGRLEHGKSEANIRSAGPLVAALHDYFASDEFVGWVRAVSGIGDLVVDPDRKGSGIHQSGDRARLGMHADFSDGPPGTVRAVNVILFVGDHAEWKPEWGGVLKLGADESVRILPVPGTLVVFESSATGWHGHPDAMTEDAPLRKSVPSYLFRPLAAGEVAEGRSTRFLVLEGA